MARGPYKKSEASRNAVLDAAIAELARRGLSATSVGDIARAAGMSKGAVHYHFASKDDLVYEVMRRCAAVMRDRVRGAWEAPGTPLDKIRRALAELRASRREEQPELRVLAELMAQGLFDENLKGELAGLFAANRQEVLASLEPSLAELGLVPRIPIAVIPRLLLGTIDGLALHDFFDPPSPEASRAVEQALETIALSLFEPIAP